MARFQSACAQMLLVVAAVAACTPDGRDNVAGGAGAEPIRAEEEFDECANPDFVGPQKESCEFRKKHCYGAMNGESLICKRSIGDLLYQVKPAELVELDGFLHRDGASLFLTATKGEAKGPRVQILSNSCEVQRVREMCTYLDGEEVTVVGAFYSEADAPSRNPYEHPLGKILVLDIYAGGRKTPPPVE